MKRLIALIVLLCIVVIGLSFAAMNTDVVAINFYFGRVSAPVSFIVVVALAIGALIGIIASFGVVLANRFEVSSLRKRVNLCERELRNLRELPFKDQ